jgi:hypothetical protein
MFKTDDPSAAPGPNGKMLIGKNKGKKKRGKKRKGKKGASMPHRYRIMMQHLFCSPR